MVDVTGFRGVRYDQAVAGPASQTSAPSYDDVDAVAYAGHRAASPYTVLDLMTPNDGLGYASAAQTLARWWRTGVLRRDPTAAFHRYDLRTPGGTVELRGLLVALAVTEPGPDAPVLVHEEVDPARVRDRLARLEAVPLDVAPVLGLYERADGDVAGLLEADPGTGHDVVAVDDLGRTHSVTALREPGLERTVRSALAEHQVLVADGHHRYHSALAHARAHAPDQVTARTLACLVDVDRHGPEPGARHRVLRRPPQDLLDRLRRWFTPEPVADPARVREALEAASPGAIGVIAPVAGAARGFVLQAKDLAALHDAGPAARSARWRALDTAVVDRVLVPGLGLNAADVTVRTDLAGAPAAVTATGAAVLVLRAVPFGDLVALARGGEALPAKTTTFSPKPRAGLVMRDVESGRLA